MYSITTATRKIAALSQRIKAVQGGTSAGKTIGIEQVLIDRCQRDNPGDVTSVVSESFPHLKRGAIRDFISIMQTQNYYKDSRWNRSDFTYQFETGAILEFFSVDQPAKTRGPRRKRLFINEANNTPFETFEQLEIRTTDEIFLDWNPTNEFWFDTEVSGKRDDVEKIILTYRDNEALSQDIIRSIEQRKNRPDWWKVFGEGLLGEIGGRIYRDWQIVDDVPHEARLERYGLNFGYTGHPAAIAAVYYYNGGYVLDEVAYGPGMLNRMLADILISQQKRAIVSADSAEPKSIAEIQEYLSPVGMTIIPVEKGKDSVRHGIAVVQDLPISITKRSTNIIKEYRNYLWKFGPDGKMIQPNEPEEPFHYSMDAVRYGIVSVAAVRRRQEIAASIPRVYHQERTNPAI